MVGYSSQSGYDKKKYSYQQDALDASEGEHLVTNGESAGAVSMEISVEVDQKLEIDLAGDTTI